MIWKPHVTVAAVIEDAGRFLLVEENIEGRLVLNQPAGHLDPGESLLDAVARETREETGWRFQPECLIGAYLWHMESHDRTFLRFTFGGTAFDHDPAQPLDDEIERALWLTPDELRARAAELRSPMVMRSIQDYLQGVRHSLDCLVDMRGAGP